MVKLHINSLFTNMKCFFKILITVALVVSICQYSWAADEATPSVAELRTQAADALTAKDSKNAIALFEQAIAADPANAPLMTDYAQALNVRINEFNFMAKGMIAGKMLKAYKTSVEIDPNHIVGWIGLSRYYLNAPPIAGGSADKAETYAKEILARVPFLGNVEMGLVEEKRGNNEKAA